MNPLKNCLKEALLLILIASLSACAYKGSPPPDTNWSFHQRDTRHASYVETDFEPTLRRKWKRDMNRVPFTEKGIAEHASPVAAEGAVFIGSIHGKGVRAVNYKTGRSIWNFKVAEGVESTPAFYEGKVYFGANNGNIYALDAKSGKELWQFSTGSELLSGAVAEGGMVFFNNTNDTLHALDGETGEVLWRYRHESSGIFAIRPSGSPAVADGIIYIGFRDGTIAAFVSFDGSILWKNRVTLKKGARFKDIDASPVVDGEALYVTSYDGGLFKLSSKTGELIWMHAGGSVATPTFDETRVYCSDKKGLVYALDKTSGETLWKYQLKKGTATSGIVIGDYYVFGSNHKRIYMIDKATGEVKSKRRLSGGLSASPAFYKGYIYALSNKGDVYAFGY